MALSGGRRAFVSLVILWLPSGSHSSWMDLDNHEHSTFHLKECLIGHEAQPALRGQLGRGCTTVVIYLWSPQPFAGLIPHGFLGLITQAVLLSLRGC